MKKYLSTLSIGAALLAAPVALHAAEEDVLDAVRYVDLPSGEAELQTGITTFTNADGVQVDLISAVHIGDESYYDALNHIFTDYDVVLYELVGGPMEERGKTELTAEMQAVHLAQRVAQAILGFRYQLDGIDYTATNFEHADVTWEEWTSLNSSKNEDLASMFFRAMSINYDEDLQKEMEAMNQEELTTNIVEAITEFSPHKLKRSLAPMLGNAEVFVTKMEAHHEGGSVIITERNKVVMNRVNETVAAGNKRVGVFYGAGHMPDLAERLTSAGYTQGDTRWLMAWQMASADAPGMTGMQALESLLKDDTVIEGLFQLFRQFTETGATSPNES